LEKKSRPWIPDVGIQRSMGMMMLYFGFWNPDLGFHVWNPKVMGMIMLYFGFWNPDLGFHV
jgi:hypothetical protein